MRSLLLCIAVASASLLIPQTNALQRDPGRVDFGRQTKTAGPLEVTIRDGRQLTREQLVDAAVAGGDYIVRMQRRDGSFHYLYDAASGKLVERGYNILRHAGVLSALYDLYAATRDPGYLRAARAGIEYLKTRFRPANVRDSLLVLDNDGKAKLGANGLALLALCRQAELDPDAADIKGARQLANLVVALQRKNGAYDSYYQLRGDEPRGNVSLYYPGEAILGLVSLYKLTKDPRLITSAQRGANYLVRVQSSMTKPPPDAWLMQALEALYRIDASPRYAAHAIRLATSIIADQYDESAPPAYRGGFGPGPPGSTPAASRAEGLLAAYRLARLIDDPRAARISSALRACAAFQLSHQYTADKSDRLPNPGRARGGFRRSEQSALIRIDFVQHNVSSLLGIASALY
jgi:hypothetical protein